MPTKLVLVVPGVLRFPTDLGNELDAGVIALGLDAVVLAPPCFPIRAADAQERDLQPNRDPREMVGKKLPDS